MLAEEGRCPGCGQPKADAWNPDSEGWYDLHTAWCNGCAPLHRAVEGDRDYQPQRKRWVEDTRPPDQPLKPWTSDHTD